MKKRQATKNSYRIRILHCSFCGHDWPTKGDPSRCPRCYNPVGRKPLKKPAK